MQGFAAMHEAKILDQDPVGRHCLRPHPGAAAEFKRLEALEREGDPAFEAPAAEITKQAGRKGGKTDKTDA